jgi:hypothetical protein
MRLRSKTEKPFSVSLSVVFGRFTPTEKAFRFFSAAQKPSKILRSCLRPTSQGRRHWKCGERFVVNNAPREFSDGIGSQYGAVACAQFTDGVRANSPSKAMPEAPPLTRYHSRLDDQPHDSRCSFLGHRTSSDLGVRSDPGCAASLLQFQAAGSESQTSF